MSKLDVKTIVNYGIIDLEFLAHTDDAVVTGVGFVKLSYDTHTRDVTIHDGIGGRVEKEDLEFMRTVGFKEESDVVAWAKDNDMDSILGAMESDNLKFMLATIAKEMTTCDYIMERSVGADIPKFMYLCKAFGISFGLPYWMVMEVRSFLAGAGCEFLNKVWDSSLTKHNPIHDALMDAKRIELVLKLRRDETTSVANKLKFLFPKGGEYSAVIGATKDDKK